MKTRFKCWSTYVPFPLGLTTASTHLLATALWPVLCPTTVLTVSPPSAQSPFAQRECFPPLGRRSFRLLREHYFSFFAPTDSFASRSELSSTSVSPRWRSLCRLSIMPVPAARRTFPTLSPSFFPWMSDPLPRRSHRVHIPVPTSVSSAFPRKGLGRLPACDPLETTSCGPVNFGAADISLCSNLQFCVPPRSSLPLRILPQGPSRGGPMHFRLPLAVSTVSSFVPV
jgi:hypothetical protein